MSTLDPTISRPDPTHPGNQATAVGELDRPALPSVFADQLARVLSHDFGAGIRHVDSFAKLLRSEYAEQLGHRGAQWLTHIVEGAERMHSYQVGVTEYLRMDGRPFEPVRAPLRTIIEAAARATSGATVAGAPSLWVHVEPRPFQRVFEHLFHNSVLHRDAISAKISLACRVLEDSRVDIQISDNGSGVPVDDGPHLFEPFFSRGTRRGLGLGLAYCQRVVRRHGGELDVRACSPSLTLSLRLPTARAE